MKMIRGLFPLWTIQFIVYSKVGKCAVDIGREHGIPPIIVRIMQMLNKNINMF
jgi:hypothetical protein